MTGIVHFIPHLKGVINIPAYKDTATNTWYCKFYYSDWTGARKQKKKRGFKTKKDALNFEVEFIKQQTNDNNMTLNSLVELYFNDMKHRLKLNTMNNKKIIFDIRILPFFKDMPLNAIKPTNIRNWQNELLNQGLSDTYLKTVNTQLVALFNYGIKYYGLKENPCHKAGTIGKRKASSIDFWTLEEYKTFISYVDIPLCKLAFNVLYYTGIRQGELFALTVNDIDLISNTITINKSLQRIEKKDIITEPKTPKSNRVITIPQYLADELKQYINTSYSLDVQERIFYFTKTYLRYNLLKYCNLSNIKKIRVHDMRHSHASLLIELGFSPLLISERLGHENVETTLNTYSHLYPNKQTEVAEKLNNLF